MKRILLVLALLCSISAFGQRQEFKKFFNEYSSRNGFTSVVFGEKMMSMLGRKAGDDKALVKLLNGIESIHILVAEEYDAKFIDAAQAVVAVKYKLMSSIVENGQTSKFYYIDGGMWGKPEFLMITYGDRENVVMDICGEFDVTDISRLSSIRFK